MAGGSCPAHWLLRETITLTHSPTLEVRRYRSSDHDAVWALHNEALAPTGAHVGNGVWDKDLHQIEDVYLNNGGEFLVGIYDGQLIAMGALKRTAAW